MFKENFVRLCNNRGEFPSSVCKKIGISPAAFSQWTNETIPRQSTLVKIADYFGVTVDDLLTDPAPSPVDEAMDKLTASMQEALDLIEKEKSPILRSLENLVKDMNQDQQMELKKFAEYLISRSKNT